MTTLLLSTVVLGAAAPSEPAPDRETLIRASVQHLLSMQESDGAWPYEGVYRVQGEIPVGYRVGGTALCCQALMHAAPADDAKVRAAIDRGIRLILAKLDEPLMQPSRQDAYDVRVWGQACALEFFAQWLSAGRAGEQEERIRAAVNALVGALTFEELEGGGWNYAGRRRHAAFVTAVVTQALLHAGEHVQLPKETLARGRDVLLSTRLETGAYYYSGTAEQQRRRSSRAEVPGAVGRAPLCETTLARLGATSAESLRRSLDQFYEHWDHLEARRRKNGTHKPPYGIAPYYFYFAHRYAAQAIELLSAEQRPKDRQRLLDLLMKTRDADGTWNDRVFPRSRNYGTTMTLMALLGERMPMPPAVDKLPAAVPNPKSGKNESAPE